MTSSAQFRSGKGAGDENFPVASWLIRRRHRPIILAFYEFVRVADDIADHSTLDSPKKIARLEQLESSLLGAGGIEPEGLALRAMLNSRGLSARHPQDLLTAFRQDITKLRYANWDELVDYCSRSAMPVGRFVLDVHGEARSTWPASDALCAALQVINHLQDCATDYRVLDRVYIPLDMLEARKIGVEALAAKQACPELQDCLRALAAHTTILLEQSQGLETSVSDMRLALEITVIRSLARRLLAILRLRDPLSEPVHLGKVEMLAAAANGGARGLLQRFLRMATFTYRYQAP